MGNFEKLSVLVIVVIIVMILVVAIYEWTGSPSEPTPATTSASVGGGGTSAQLRSPAPDPFIIEPGPRSVPAPTPSPAPRPGSKPGPDGTLAKVEDPWDMNGDWTKQPLIPDPSPAPAPAPTPDPAPAPAPAPAPSATEIPETVHVVASGDTLGGISKTYYGKSSLYSRIMDANPGVTPESLRVGTKLKIPALRIEASAAPVGPSGTSTGLAASGDRPIPGKDYKVRRGDTWQSISKIAFNSIERWPEIYVRNMKKVKTQSDLADGLVISIPK